MIVGREAQKSRPAHLPRNGSVSASLRFAQNQGQRSCSSSFSPSLPLHVDLRLETKREGKASRDRPAGSTPWKRSKMKGTVSLFQRSQMQVGKGRAKLPLQVTSRVSLISIWSRWLLDVRKNRQFAENDCGQHEMHRSLARNTFSNCFHFGGEACSFKSFRKSVSLWSLCCLVVLVLGAAASCSCCA